jgi:RNA polymerase sigma factor (sigma-70 family)
MSYHLWTSLPDPAARGPAAAGGVPAASRQAVTLLFRERHAELVRLAALLLGSRPAAEDVVQDVFTRLCSRDYLTDRNPLAYVRAAVVNGCRSAQRHSVAARRASDRQAGLAALPQFSAEDEVLLAEDRREVIAALQSLPARRREVLVLRYWLGLTDTEISEVLGISRGTVSSAAARALAALARKLGEDE